MVRVYNRMLELYALNNQGSFSPALRGTFDLSPISRHHQISDKENQSKIACKLPDDKVPTGMSLGQLKDATSFLHLRNTDAPHNSRVHRPGGGVCVSLKYLLSAWTIPRGEYNGCTTLRPEAVIYFTSDKTKWGQIILNILCVWYPEGWNLEMGLKRASALLNFYYY